MKQAKITRQAKKSSHSFVSYSLFLFVTIILTCTPAVFSHDPGLSATEIKIVGDRVEISSTYSEAELGALISIDSNGGGGITPSEFASVRSRIEKIAGESLILEIDGRRILPFQVAARTGESNSIQLDLSMPLDRSGRISYKSELLKRLARGHRQYVTLRAADGKTISAAMLDANHDTFTISIDEVAIAGSRRSGFPEFLILGIEHILLGFDHLAFLLALLIVVGTVREAAAIITTFTIAHSITLGLASLNVANLSPALVEPLIALSIIFAGAENIRLRRAGGSRIKIRIPMTFAFGLIHGFGFASVLRELGIGGGREAIFNLFSFNLGVEIGQIAIAAIVLPMIWKLERDRSLVSRYATACSLLVALAGLYWLIERTLKI